MKGLAVALVMLFLASCTTTRTQIVEYRTVSVTPPVLIPVTIQTEPIDVTTTTVEYY